MSPLTRLSKRTCKATRLWYADVISRNNFMRYSNSPLNKCVSACTLHFHLTYHNERSSRPVPHGIGHRYRHRYRDGYIPTSTEGRQGAKGANRVRSCTPLSISEAKLMPHLAPSISKNGIHLPPKSKYERQKRM